MLSLCPDLSDIILQAFIARRQLLHQSGDFIGLRVIGSRYSATSKITSSSTGIPSGRLATPMTSRTGIFSMPKMSRNKSETASATLG